MSGRSGRVKPASLAGECGIKKGQSHSVEDCALRCMSAVLELSKQVLGHSQGTGLMAYLFGLSSRDKPVLCLFHHDTG